MPSRPSAYQKRIMAVLEEYRDKEPRPGAERRHLQRIWREFVYPMRWRLLLCICLSLMMTLQPYLWTFIQRFAFDVVMGLGKGYTPHELLHHTVSLLWLHLPAYQWVFVLFVINSGIHVISLIFSWNNSFQITLIGQKIVFELRKALHERLQTLPLSFFDRTQTGRLLTVVLDDVATIQTSVTHITINTFTQTASILVGLGIVFSLNWKIGLLVLIAIPGYVFNYRYFRPKLRDANIAARRATTALYSRVEERVGAIRTVKVFGRERSEGRSFAESAYNLARLTMYIVRLGNWQNLVATTVSATATFATLYVGAMECQAYIATLNATGDTARAAAAGMSPGAVWQLYRCTLFLFAPAVLLNDLTIEMQRVGVVLRRIFDLLESEAEPPDREDAIEVPDARGDITFTGVTFTYPGDLQSTLRNVHFAIPAGTQVAVLGPSGSGKSTLLYLIMRFYDPEFGEITLDGHDLRDIKLRSLRERVTLVMQEPVIFSGTIAENIRYGRLDASESDVRRAARDADLHNFVMTLPDGYDTVVGERGMSLSGGQRQRLALAASLLSRPSVLLLDDTTSALDPATEARVRETLTRLMKDRTCFVVTHRVSTAMASDLVLVLEDGELTQFGSPGELLIRDGLFRRIYEQQTRESADLAVTND